MIEYVKCWNTKAYEGVAPDELWENGRGQGWLSG